MRVRLRAITVITLGSLLTLACNEMTTVGTDEPTLEAAIVQIQMDGHTAEPRILLGDAHDNGIWFTVTSSTILERLEMDGTTVPIDLEELNVGDRAQAWHSGPISDSLPQQAVASRIRVLGST